jgi:hypothetical protein
LDQHRGATTPTAALINELFEQTVSPNSQFALGGRLIAILARPFATLSDFPLTQISDS